VLHFHCTARGIHGAREFEQYTVARPLNDAAAMFRDLGFEELSPVRIKARERALFVCTHKPTVAGHIAREDSGQTPLYSRLGHLDHLQPPY
jgi:hypothetical protein